LPLPRIFRPAGDGTSSCLDFPILRRHPPAGFRFPRFLPRVTPPDELPGCPSSSSSGGSVGVVSSILEARVLRRCRLNKSSGAPVSSLCRRVGVVEIRVAPHLSPSVAASNALLGFPRSASSGLNRRSRTRPAPSSLVFLLRLPVKLRAPPNLYLLPVLATGSSGCPASPILRFSPSTRLRVSPGPASTAGR